MSLRTLTSGLIEKERGLRPALQASTRCKSRDVVIRIKAEAVSGWVGILFGKYVTGARAQTSEGISEGMKALRSLIGVTEGKFDVLEIDSPTITDELKQSLGVDLTVLLDLAKARSEDSLVDLLTEAETPLSALQELADGSGDKETELAASPGFELAVIAQSEKELSTLEEAAGTQISASAPGTNFTLPGQDGFEGVPASPGDGAVSGQVASFDAELTVFQDLEKTLRRARRQISGAPLSHLDEDWVPPPAVSVGPEDENARSLYQSELQKKTGSTPKEFVSIKSREEAVAAGSRARVIKVVIGVTVIALAVPLILSTVSKLSDQTAYHLAQEKMTAGDLEGARRVYDKLIAATHSATAYVGRAQTWPEGSVQRLRDYERAVRIDPTNTPVTLKLADMLFDVADYDKAFIVAQVASAQDPGSAEAAKISGQCLSRLGRVKEAEISLKQALGISQTNKGPIAYELALLMSGIGKRDQALDYLNQAIADSPNNYEFRHARAKHKVQDHDFVGALEDLKVAMVSSIVPPEDYYLRALCWNEKSENQKIIDDLNRAIDGGLDSLDAHRRLGLAYSRQGQYGPAIAHLDTVLKSNPQDSQCAKARQSAFLALKSRAPVRTLPLNDNTAIPVAAVGNELQKGYQALQTKDMSTAVALLTVAVRANPNSPEARRYLGYALSGTGQYAQAAAQFQALAALNALKPEDNLTYGKALSKAGKYESAVTVLHSLVDSNPRYSDARAALIKAYLLAGFNEHARTQCLEGIKLAQSDRERQLFQSLMP